MKTLEDHRPDLIGDGYDVEPLLSAKKVGAILDVPHKEVYDLIGLPRVRISKNRVRWRPRDVREFIDRRLEE